MRGLTRGDGRGDRNGMKDGGGGDGRGDRNGKRDGGGGDGRGDDGGDGSILDKR